MTDDKTKVKDLAAELGVPTRDLLGVLRELNIQVKSPMSAIPADDLPRVRARFASAQSGKAEERREIQPGVIVRRRRHAQRNGEQADDAPRQTRPDMRSDAQPGVRLDNDAQEPDEASSVSETGEATAAPVEAASSRPLAGGAEETRRSRERSRKRAVRENAPAAKVISRPGDNRSGDNRSGDAVPARPVEAVDPAPAETPVEIAQAPAPEPEVADAAATPVEDVQTDTAEAPAVTSGENDARPARKMQPAASAVPEGSSAPSLLPPVSDGNRSVRASGDEEKDDSRPSRHDGRKRRAPDVATPQVRVISRPDPAAVAAARNRDAASSSSDSRSERGNDGYRGGQRAGGYQNQGNRGSYQGQGGRPGGGMFPPAGAPATPDREGQSKKKRNKRRTVDFQGEMNLPGRRHEDDDDMPRASRGPKRRPKNRPAPQAATQPIKAAKRKIRVEEAIRVADMAHQMGLKSNEIIKVLFNLGIMATINKALDLDTAAVVAAEFGYEVEKVGFAEEDYLTAPREADAPELLKLRPPVVTIMGHVDHGKTSLLDAIRKTHVTAGEAGGITQHIGAYHVKTKRGEIVFLDTPGHEAVTAMRARGAQVTDLVVLVVAADDGVMEQTREAVNHSRAAGVPIMVAVNKMDKPEANPDRVLRELAEIGLVPEDWGGDTVVSRVSAKTREGLDDLLELLALQADILELKANPDKPARGHIVEAKLDKGRGPVATVLIQDGTLRQGDTFVCGVFSGRVRAMFNDQGRKVKEAGPSIPVEVQGFEGVPEAGEEFICLADEKLARRIAASRAVKQRERELAKESRVTLETFLARSSDDEEAKTLNLVVKADVQGSLEAILEALRKQSTDKVRINIIHGGAGAITESDILLASASDAIVIGFNVRPAAKVKEVAEHENVDIRFYDIIYKLVDEIKSAMTGLLAPVSREVYLGQAEVRETFSVPKVGVIAGSHVVDGKITRNAGIRILRNGVVAHTGKIASLRRFKDDVKEVLKGYECGIGLENFNDIKVGDVIEAFETVEEAATL